VLQREGKRRGRKKTTTTTTIATVKGVENLSSSFFLLP
jgi:hypothetical protein